jgi:hypothetical protein
MSESKLPVEYAARLAFWRHIGWQELPASTEDAIWERFEKRFGFFGTGIREPAPSLTWDITPVFGRGQAWFESLEQDLNLKTLRALQSCTTPGERVYALDWQHPCFWFDPRAGVVSGNTEHWAVPVLPDGDHYVFLASDLRFGTIGIMETSVCVFGEGLLNAFAADPPKAFTRLLRKDGQPI